ncbi:MAG: hypothetical protein AB7F76_17050 [Parvibaculaceae bacterium]
MAIAVSRSVHNRTGTTPKPRRWDAMDNHLIIGAGELDEPVLDLVCREETEPAKQRRRRILPAFSMIDPKADGK